MVGVQMLQLGQGRLAAEDEDAAARSEPAAPPEAGSALPVTGTEPSRGDPLAPVTLIV